MYSFIDVLCTLAKVHSFIMKSTIKKHIAEAIKIPSLSGHERNLADHLFTCLLLAGLKPKKQNGNVVVRIPGKNPNKALIFNAHMDTIGPGPLSLWKYPPYGKDAGMEESGKIYGVGASDDKASLGTLLALAEVLAKEQPPIDVWITFVREEGTGGNGTKAFLEWWQENHHPEKYQEVSVVVCGPTEMKEVRVGHRGNFNALVTTLGEGGHGSQADHNKTRAIPEMQKIISAFTVLEKSWQKKYSDSTLGKPTIAVTSISAGDQFSPTKFPDICSITLDVRTTPKLHKIAFKEIEATAKKLKATAKIIYNPAPPGHTDPKAKIVVEAKKLVGKIGVGTDSTDLCFFSELGIPGIILGPGTPEVIHKANEYCEIEKAEKAVQVYKKLIANLA